MNRRHVLLLIALVIVTDAALIFFGIGLLVHSSPTMTQVYQGDIVVSASAGQRGPDFSEPMKSADCYYWDGFRIITIGMRPPCPSLMRRHVRLF